MYINQFLSGMRIIYAEAAENYVVQHYIETAVSHSYCGNNKRVCLAENTVIFFVDKNHKSPFLLDTRFMHAYYSEIQ